MSFLRRHRWRFVLALLAVFSSIAISLGYALASDSSVGVLVGQPAAPAATGLDQISSDSFTNPDSNHKTQVEPSSFAFGNTIVTAMQSGRFYDGGGSDISFSTSMDGGKTWTTGTLPATVNSTPRGPYARLSDASVAYDAKDKTWLISYLGIKTTSTADVDVSISTDGGQTFGAPIIVSSQGKDLLDKNWTTCDNSPRSRFYGNC